MGGTFIGNAYPGNTYPGGDSSTLLGRMFKLVSTTISHLKLVSRTGT